MSNKGPTRFNRSALLGNGFVGTRLLRHHDTRLTATEALIQCVAGDAEGLVGPVHDRHPEGEPDGADGAGAEDQIIEEQRGHGGAHCEGERRAVH